MRRSKHRSASIAQETICLPVCKDPKRRGAQDFKQSQQGKGGKDGIEPRTQLSNGSCVHLIERKMRMKSSYRSSCYDNQHKMISKLERLCVWNLEPRYS